MKDEQRALAESSLTAACTGQIGSIEGAGRQLALGPNLQERFEQLLGFARNPNWSITALENVAAARELADTAYTLGAIDTAAWKSYVTETNLVKSGVIGAERQRAFDARAGLSSSADENGVRPAESSDGACRFNPLTGHHE